MTATELNQAIVTLYATTRRAVETAARELELSAWNTQSLDAPTTGGGTSDPTSIAAEQDWRRRDYHKIVATLEHANTIIERTLNRIYTSRTGKTCRTPGCHGDGLTTYGGRCHECGSWIAANPGFTPDQMVDQQTGRSLVDDWNDRRPRECKCSMVCCPEGCLDLIPAGKKQNMSDRCYKRRERLGLTA